MTGKYAITLLAILLIGSAGAVQAEGGMAEEEVTAEHFQRYDTNGDGVVSLEEARATESEVLVEKFGAYDENGDQTLDKGEFAKFSAEEGQWEEEAGTGYKEKRLNE